MQQVVAPSVRSLIKRAESAMQKGRAQEVVDCCQQVLGIQPQHADALYMIGRVLHSAGNYLQAQDFYQRAMYAEPDHLDVRLMLSEVLRIQGHAVDAVNLCTDLVTRWPKDVRTHAQLVRMWMQFGCAHLVAPYLEQVLPQFPSNIELERVYCMALKGDERTEEAEAAYQKFKGAKRFPADARFMYEMYLPRVYASSHAIDAVRAKLQDAIERFTREKPSIPIHQITYSLFYLAFHNRDNKALLQSYNRMLRLIARELNYVAPHCKPGAVRRDGKLRIGFLSNNMHYHSVGNCYRGVFAHLAHQPEFEVTFFNLSGIVDETHDEMRGAGISIVPMPANLQMMQQVVAGHQLDILIYPDIGMHPMTHYIAMARLAPHQICLGGHPETTGIDTIDYVVGSRSYEPPHAQENYTERLLCVDGVNTILSRPTFAEHFLSRNELGLPEDRKLYVCPMAIQKFHPDYDRLLADILAADPQATLVLFNDFQMESATALLQGRILSQCDPARVIFMPWLSLEKFQSVLHAADVLLDTIYFGGGSTAHYAFPMGVPMVTWPGNYARGRCIAAYYDVMGVVDAPIADSAESYVALACKVANDPVYRAHLSQQLVANSDQLFEITSYAPLVVQMMHDVVAGDLEKYKR